MGRRATRLVGLGWVGATSRWVDEVRCVRRMWGHRQGGGPVMMVGGPATSDEAGGHGWVGTRGVAGVGRMSGRTGDKDRQDVVTSHV